MPSQWLQSAPSVSVGSEGRRGRWGTPTMALYTSIETRLIRRVMNEVQGVSPLAVGMVSPGLFRVREGGREGGWEGGREGEGVCVRESVCERARLTRPRPASGAQGVASGDATSTGGRYFDQCVRSSFWDDPVLQDHLWRAPRLHQARARNAPFFSPV